MANSKVFIYFLIMLITAYPASAEGVSLNRWVLNVTIHEDGLVEEVIQAEIENGASSQLDGFSFVVPASKVTISSDDIVSIPATGQEVKQQAIQDGVKININFNTPVEAGKKWNGRIGLKAENWAVKEGSNYSVDIPVKAPQAIVSGKNIEIIIPSDADIRSQVFFPKSVEVTSVTQTPLQKPFKKLFQNNRVVITWFTDNLHIGDVIKINSSFSTVLDEITETNEKGASVSARIKEAKANGLDVREAEAHLKNAEDYNNNQALASFWKKENDVALQYVGYANDELELAENSLSGKTELTPEETPESKKTPGFGAAGLILILLVSLRKK